MPEPLHIPDVLSVADAAKLLHLTDQRVRRLVSQGEIQGSKIGSNWVLSRESVETLAREKGLLALRSSGPKSERPGPKKELSLLSFFTGAMGLDLGLEAAGFRTLLACEFDKWSRATIQANRPDLPLLGDIWNCTAESVREAAGLSKSDDIEVIAGGPPCQAFSTAGARRGFEDVRGNVFLHFIELAMELQPRYLVLENVRGLLSAALKHRPISERGKGFPALTEEETPGGALKHIVHLVEQRGYSVAFNLYNSANFGAPQIRERVILICSREGDEVPYLSPTRSDDPAFGLPPWKTFREAVAGLPQNQTHINFPEDRLRYYRLLKPGQYWKHLPEELQKQALGNSYFSGGGKTGFLRRLAWDRPSPTLVTHPAMPATDLAHPEELRPLSIEEYKRIQGFPDDWLILGPLIQQYKQVGNAVPIPLGTAVGAQLMAHHQGNPLKAPENFPYSRYRGTSHIEFLGRAEATLF